MTDVAREFAAHVRGLEGRLELDPIRLSRRANERHRGACTRAHHFVQVDFAIARHIQRFEDAVRHLLAALALLFEQAVRQLLQIGVAEASEELLQPVLRDYLDD